MSARHSAASCRWYTPPAIVDAARYVLGRIDLDVASDATAQAVVRAERWYDRDGLAQPWDAASLWLNPPTPPRAWWDRAVAAHAPTVYLAYSIEQLQQSQGWAASMLGVGIVCIPRQRIRFGQTAGDAIEALARRASAVANDRDALARLRPTYERLRAMPPDAIVLGAAPPHASAIVGLRVDRERFRVAFGPFGEVVG